MEKRQLDFNAPLLSARRFTSPKNSSELVQWQVSEKRLQPSHQSSLPLKKSEWESGYITKPASVPFNWEQTPGRPKNDPETRPPNPRLPPGEIPNLPPGRQSPGPSRYFSGDRSDDQNNTIYGDHARLLQKLSDSLNCRDQSDSSETGSEEEDSYSYSDALNSVSLTETWSDSKPKPSGRFSVDKQTRELMMRRFLPAAKAAVLKTPQKEKVISEKQKEVSKVVSREIITKPLIVKHKGSEGLPPYFGHPDFDNVESEDDEELNSVVPVKKPGKYSWGINISRICASLKNSLPSMKSKSRPSTPSNGEDRRFGRNSVSGPLDKNGSQVLTKKKFYSGLILSDWHRLENSNSNRSSNELCHQLLNSPSRSGLSPMRRYRSGNISPCRNESPKSTFRSLPNINDKEDARKIVSSLKMFRALQDVSRTNQVKGRGPSGPMDSDLVEEKTVYVDSISRRAVKPDQEEGKKAGFKYADEAKDVKMYRSRGQESRGMGLRGGDVKFRIQEGYKSGNNYIGGECDDLPLKSALPPPLPKLPSESWLWRTLPSIPMGNLYAHSHPNSPIHSKKQGLKDDHTLTGDYCEDF